MLKLKSYENDLLRKVDGLHTIYNFREEPNENTANLFFVCTNVCKESYGKGITVSIKFLPSSLGMQTFIKHQLLAALFDPMPWNPRKIWIYAESLHILHLDAQKFSSTRTRTSSL